MKERTKTIVIRTPEVGDSVHFYGGKAWALIEHGTISRIRNFWEGCDVEHNADDPHVLWWYRVDAKSQNYAEVRFNGGRDSLLEGFLISTMKWDSTKQSWFCGHHA